MWERRFQAEAEGVAGLRRLLQLQLELWGLEAVSESAQLCVTELVANVIKHVGSGTPATLAVRASDGRLRIEVHDPDPRALPVLIEASSDAEGGRGMALVDAVTDRWGVDLTTGRKATWCEFALPTGQVDPLAAGPRMTRAVNVIGLYVDAVNVPAVSQPSRLGALVAEEAAINVIADLLHWLDAQGRDPDEVLERAQAHFEAEAH